jgi:glycosyltransferase involved in cell wall biosynthesis
MQEMQHRKLQPIDLNPLSGNPLISVLIANYNYAKYIGKTLDSVLSQTYSNFEAIVCDDGSKDSSCEIIETYLQKDSRIKLIRKSNGGVASALNSAYKESKGQIVCLLDADDIWMNHKLEKVVKAFNSNLKYGFVIHNVIQIDGQDNYLKSSPMYGNLASGWMAESALENGGFVYNIPPASALTIRREIAELIFPLNEEFRRNADSLIFRIAPFITVIGCVPEILSQFRLHGANTTSLPILTVDMIEKEQPTLARIHQEQEKFLNNFYGTEVAQKLTDWRCSLTVRRNLYLIARLKGASGVERKKMHQQLLEHPNFSTMYLPQKLLLQWGECLPKAIFSLLFDQIYGANRIKRFVKSLLDVKPSANQAWQ